MSDEGKPATSQPGAIAAPGDVLFDKYRVERVIGQGGMGFVVEAFHLLFEERIAIKFLLPELRNNEEAVARFEREARALFRIKCENVVQVLDVGTTDSGAPFMVMEFLEGQDLADMLADRQQFPIERAVDFALQTCAALAEAHVRNIVHRDLKPENLFVTEGPDGKPRIKLLDFGLSKDRASEETRTRKLTANQQVMGTPHYMAPEQWMSSKDVGPAADQWSLASILFETLTGVPPFDAPAVAQICSKVLNEPTPSIAALRPDVPPGLALVVTKGLEKEIGHRYENIGAMAIGLSAFAPSGAVAKAERALKMLREARYVDSDAKPFQAPSVRRASDMAATVPRPPLEDLAGRVRTVTANSWQNILDHSRRRSRTAVFIAFAAVFAMVIGSIAFIGSRDTGTASAAATESLSLMEPTSNELASADVPETATPPNASTATPESIPSSKVSAKPRVVSKPKQKPRRAAKSQVLDAPPTPPDSKVEPEKPKPEQPPANDNPFEYR